MRGRLWLNYFTCVVESERKKYPEGEEWTDSSWTDLKKHLEDVIWEGGLVKGTDGDLLVIIDNESAGGKAPWGEYFTVFEWRNDRLEKIEGLEF